MESLALWSPGWALSPPAHHAWAREIWRGVCLQVGLEHAAPEGLRVTDTEQLRSHLEKLFISHLGVAILSKSRMNSFMWVLQSNH